LGLSPSLFGVNLGRWLYAAFEASALMTNLLATHGIIRLLKRYLALSVVREKRSATRGFIDYGMILSNVVPRTAAIAGLSDRTPQKLR
jgi:hypothetical protein